MLKGRVSTVLGEWLKLATKEQQEELCKRCGTSIEYMRLLSNAYRENPKLRLALAIVTEANNIAGRDRHSSPVQLPHLTLVGLAVPTRRGLSPLEVRSLNHTRQVEQGNTLNG